MNTTNPQGDLLQPHSNSPSAVTLEELRAQQCQFQMLFIAALTAIVIMALFICFFMGKQWRMIRAQVLEQRPTVQKMYADYQKTTEPLVRNFTGSLQAFAVKNRDFQPILDKYREPLRPYFPGGASAAPAPAASGTQH